MARSLLGVAYVAGAAVNLAYTTRHPELLDDWVAAPLLPGYRWFFTEVVAAHPTFWIPLAAAGEVLLAVLLLARGRIVKLGLGLSIGFQLLLAPMWVGQTVANLVLAAIQVPLLRAGYPRSIPERLLGPGRPRRRI